MKLYFIPIIGLLILIYGSINFYIGLRGWQALGSHFVHINIAIYWILVWFAAVSYIIARAGSRILPGFIYKSLNLLGSYWFAAMLYFLAAIIIIDVIRLLNKWLNFIPQGYYNSPNTVFILGMGAILLVTVLMAFGTWNAQNVKISRYDVSIGKSVENIKSLDIVMVSDLHLGDINGKRNLNSLVNKINELKPDIVFIPGDIVDDDLGPYIKNEMWKTFLKIKTRYGVYGTLGNHDYYGSPLKDKLNFFKKSGINILLDSNIKIAESFYVVGRVDKSAGSERKNLSDVMKGVDTGLPVILLDHQPIELEEVKDRGVDLMLSGHTHRGQFFPVQFITNRIFENDWGYSKKGNLNIVVSSGAGTWGPPIRLGTISEIVEIKLNFK